MKETAVADFVGRFALDPGGGADAELSGCRVVMSRRRIVVAADERTTIPLSDVVDVVVGNVPPGLRRLFDDSVTIGYETDDGDVRTVLVEANNETISRFVDVLFRCLLDRTEVVCKHPAKAGGRVLDADAETGELSVVDRRVEVTIQDDEFDVDVSAVVDFERVADGPEWADGPVLVVTHADGADVLTTLVAPDCRRTMNLLGRYLQLEYRRVRKELATLELDDPETRLLVSIYSAGGDADYTELLDADESVVESALETLEDEDLLETDLDDVVLSRRGKIAAIHRFGAVDD